QAHVAADRPLQAEACLVHSRVFDVGVDGGVRGIGNARLVPQAERAPVAGRRAVGPVSRAPGHVPGDPGLVSGRGHLVDVVEDPVVVLAVVALQYRLVVTGKVEGKAEAGRDVRGLVHGVLAGSAAGNVI